MPYTLAKFFLWGLLMASAGGVVGWLLRSLKCRGEVARVRAVTIDGTELERLRGRVANLEPLVAERDRLRMELADVRGSSAGALGFASTGVTSIIPERIEDDGSAAMAPAVDDAADARRADPPDSVAPEVVAPEVVAPEVVAPEVAAAAAAPDVSRAAAVLGKRIKLDDLTVVEGIGPKIAELCSGINVTTWQGLADAEVAELQSMLDAAGSRFQMHKPASWPQQAALLASGRWAEFKEFTESLSGGT